MVDAQKYSYAADDIRFIVDESAHAGVKVAAHVQTERGARAAIEAGVASIEHGWVLSDEDLAFARKNKFTLVSTDFTIAELQANGKDADTAKRTHQRYVSRLKSGLGRRRGRRVRYGHHARRQGPDAWRNGGRIHR